MEFTREIIFEPAFDGRNPDPEKNHGIRGVRMRWILKKGNEAVQFLVFTNWQLPSVSEELKLKGNDFLPMPADLGYHSPVPRYEGQTLMSKKCEYIGCPCYYDGSGLNAQPVFELLIKKGSEAVWGKLEEYFNNIFGKGAQNENRE